MIINRLLVMNLLSVYLIWGTTYYAIKLSIDAMPPLLMLSVRFFIAALIIGVFCLVKRIKFPGNKTTYFWEFIIGNLLLLGGLGSVAFAEKWISSALAAIVIATVPIWLLALDFIINKKKLSKTKTLFIAIGFMGIIMLNYYEIKGYNFLAITLCLIAPLSWSLGSILHRRVAPENPVNTIVSACLQMFSASISFAIIFLLTGNEYYLHLDFIPVVAIIYLIFFGSILAFSSYIYLCNQHISSALLGSYAYINPVVAVFIGLVFAGEFISTNGYIAICIILISVVLLLFDWENQGRRNQPAS
ncbi:EamA family transporter [Candidatus Spongiihabitans sp.]|uniref:EamA family transporter n=1 Tax=Candidatus Spongiihabitans sp. TaxID=3101308 RepID=UPI003C6F1D30